MIFEVEKKFWLVSGERTIEMLQQQHDVTFGPAIEQIDKYFQHPARDFVKTDEVLRLRVSGEQNFITYKGARIDSTTKTRRELELPLLDGAYSQDFEKLLVILGFQPYMTVNKFRRKAELSRDEYRIEISMDEIDQLGSFIELETTSDLQHLDKAKSALESLASELQLDRPERCSYLELLLNQLGPNRFAS